MDLNDYIVRIIVCIVLSMLIGIERQYRHGTVGLRTNVLVALGAFMFNYAGDKLYIVLDYGTSYYRITSSRLFYDKSFIGFSLSNRHAYTSIIMYLIDNHPDMFNSLAKHIFMSGGKTKYAEEVAMNSDALFFIIKECIDRGSIL